jgi:YVTN family beta-propeller protein
VVSAFSNTATLVDGGTNEVGQPIPVGSSPAAVAVGPDAVWVANRGDGTVSRIDPATRLVVETITVGGSPIRIEVDPGSGSVWVLLD